MTSTYPARSRGTTRAGGGGISSAATTDAAGIVELATAAEVQTGTDTARVPSVASMVAGGGQVLITESVAAAGGVASFDFSSIPTTFRHLRLEFLLRSNRANTTDDLLVALNNDTTVGNYDYQRVEERNGGTSQAEALGTSRSIGEVNANTASTSHFTVGWLLIRFYDQTASFKMVEFEHTRWTARTTGTMRRWTGTLGWASTSAVDRITLAPSLGTAWVEGSAATLYGIG